MSHFTIENRKTISRMIAHGAKCKEIAAVLGCDPTSVSKEVKRNRMITKSPATGKKFLCRRLDRFPFVCRDCPHKYKDCAFVQFRYDASYAQERYEHLLHGSRRGIDLTPEEHRALNDALKYGLKNKKSVYEIAKTSPLGISASTIYRYIEERKVDVTKMDLPCAVTYKKRKRQNKKYEYPENAKISRYNRTFLDYLAYKKSHINEFGSQMDFLGSIKSDKKSILVIIIPELHFPILRIVESKNARKVVEVFDEIERRIGYDKFAEVFPSILTDRDPSFADIQGIEFSKEVGAQRCHLFFCDAFKSNQKASVENMNKQIRKFFPKGQSVDGLTQDEVDQINLAIVRSPLFSLSGFTPKEAFCRLFGEETFDKLFNL